MTRAVVANGYGGPEVLEVVEEELAPPGPGQVRIEVRAAGVNPADVKAYSGIWGTDPSALPKRLGYEAAGVVTAVGPDASGPLGPVSVGDEVIGYRINGAYASEVVVPADAVVPKPDSLDWAPAGGLLLCGATAYHALEAAGVGEHDTVLVHGGSGGVGLMAVQLGRLRGARVIATASERNHALLRELGAEPVTYGAGLLDRVRELAPDGVDAALDLVGTDEAMDVSLALVDRDRIATIANFARAPKEGVRLLGSGPGADPGDELRQAVRPELTQLAGAGRLRVVVAATFLLAQAADAHRLVAGGHTTGKVVLLP
jgi:NADPH:quinone reductase-like Zn-dependent oxidoreductase